MKHNAQRPSYIIIQYATDTELISSFPKARKVCIAIICTYNYISGIVWKAVKFFSILNAHVDKKTKYNKK